MFEKNGCLSSLSDLPLLGFSQCPQILPFGLAPVVITAFPPEIPLFQQSEKMSSKSEV